MNAEVRRRSLQITPEVDRLTEVRAFVRDAAAAAGATERATGDLVQAVDEAVCNVIVHGYRGAPGEIELETEATDGRLRITILDRSAAFDPTAAPEPDLTVPPMARRPGGMGIHLVRSMVDEVHHRPRPGGGNELTLIQSVDEGAEED